MKQMVLIFAALAILAAAWLYFEFKPHLEKDIRLGGHAFHVTVADSMAKRAQGLSGHAPLAENEGMLFIFPIAAKYPFWMKDMRFALDIIWIRGDAVVGITSDVPPPPAGAAASSLFTYAPPVSADKVLEVNAGTAARLDIKAGDKLVQ